MAKTKINSLSLTRNKDAASVFCRLFLFMFCFVLFFYVYSFALFCSVFFCFVLFCFCFVFVLIFFFFCPHGIFSIFVSFFLSFLFFFVSRSPRSGWVVQKTECKLSLPFQPINCDSPPTRTIDAKPSSRIFCLLHPFRATVNVAIFPPSATTFLLIKQNDNRTNHVKKVDRGRVTVKSYQPQPRML